jgi:hypothetical protein
MNPARDFKGTALAGIAAFLGTDVGNELRVFILDQLEARRRRAQGLPAPEKRIYLQTLGEHNVPTNALIALLLASRAERRRPLYAFVIGALLTVLIGDRFDRILRVSVNGG